MRLTNVLDGVYAKLDRARVHATELKTLVEDALRNAGGFEAAPGDTSGELVLYAAGLPRIEPGWSATLGDFLTNLRAALDHFAWRLVELSGGTPDCRTGFPIRRPGKSVTAPLVVSGGVRRDLLAEIGQLQPDVASGQAEGGPESNELHVLNELVNIDKHRMLLVMVARVDLAGSWWYVTDVPHPTPRFTAGPIDTGAVVARFDFPDDALPAGFDPHLRYTVAVNDGPDVPAIRHVGIIVLMERLYFHVEHMVVGSMAHHFGLDHRPIVSVYPY